MSHSRNRNQAPRRGAFDHGAASSVLSDGRARFILFVFLAIASVFLLRLVFLQVIVAGDYSEQASISRTSVIDVPAKRGTIYDRNGNVLAMSVDAKTVYCNPNEVTDASWEAEQIASVLGGKSSDYEGLLETEDTSFVYIQRKVELETAEKLMEMELDGVHFLEDSKRVYPYGEVAGQIIGLTDIDDNGQSGLELYYDDILKGTAGRIVAEYGQDGMTIPGGTHEYVQAVNGQDIVISIDIGMQQKVEESLKSGVETIEGKAGSAVLMDGGTGEIYAIASLPLLNPADRTKVEAGATEIKAVSSAFEPGSIFKTVTFMAIMEAGVLTPDDTIFCPAALPADEYYVTDAHERGDETMTVRDILNRSSNVGTSLAASKLGFPALYDKIVEYNLTEATGVDFPGESGGYLTDQSQWSTIQSYNVSFGQGVSVTPLQITRFYGALVNEGVECTPHFLLKNLTTGEEPQWSTEKVIENTDAIDTVDSMLQTVVTDGTGTTAAVEGYQAAGKTGTAEYADEEGGYVEGVYNISFTGYLSNTNSQLVCFVGATEVPGDRTMTGTFSDIMTFATERYRIIAY